VGCLCDTKKAQALQQHTVLDCFSEWSHNLICHQRYECTRVLTLNTDGGRVCHECQLLSAQRNTTRCFDGIDFFGHMPGYTKPFVHRNHSGLTTPLHFHFSVGPLVRLTRSSITFSPQTNTTVGNPMPTYFLLGQLHHLQANAREASVVALSAQEM